MRIAGAGCALIDHLYQPINTRAPAFEALRSRTPGDGGLTPGQLVFMESLARFAQYEPDKIVAGLTRGAAAHALNVGGPAIVALILAAQLLDPAAFHVEYHGAIGADESGRELCRRAGQTPLDASRLVMHDGATAATIVLNDPCADGGHGERTFINTLGVAAQYGPSDLVPAFFTADLVLLGATALVPRLHCALDELLRRARGNGALTVVGTVYDFLNQRRDPHARWPLGSGDSCYALIDLLVCDEAEALRLSGESSAQRAGAWFLERGVGAWAITRGIEPVLLGAREGGPFAAPIASEMPVLAGINAARSHQPCDTTGAGDNFLGGVLAALGLQRAARRPALDLAAAIALGVCAGGCACLQCGGVALETHSGHKRAQVRNAYERYRRQVTPAIALPPCAMES
jgi:sugar/nucleoside kinase (ribokinase family)